MVYGRGLSPVREVGEQSSRASKLEEETLLMDFLIWLVAVRPSGKRILVDTAMKYIYEVQAWSARLVIGGGRIGGGLDLARLRALAVAMRRQLGDAEKTPRYGVRTQDLAAAMKAKLGGDSADVANWRAALTTGFCALMRGGEIGVSDDDTWDAALHLTRADLSFFRDEAGVLHARIWMRPLKKSAGARKTVPIVLKSGGTLLDPVLELWKLVHRDPLAKGESAASRPLFRDTLTGRAFRVADVRRVIKWLMASLRLDPARFGAHSLRIGGATAALAAGVQPSTIRLLGRWASDVSDVYMRVSRQSASHLSQVVGSTSFHDLERNTFKEEELEVLPSEWRGIEFEDDLFEDDEGIEEDLM